jgi:hypothetical protein
LKLRLDLIAQVLGRQNDRGRRRCEHKRASHNRQNGPLDAADFGLDIVKGVPDLILQNRIRTCPDERSLLVTERPV